MDRNFILSRVRAIEVDDLFNAIKEGIVTLEDLRKTGNLVHTKRKEIEDRLAAEQKVFQVEDEIWQGAQSYNTTASYNNYLSSYPNGRYADQARDRLDAIRASYEAKKLNIIREIREVPDEFTPERLNKLFNSGKLVEEDLFTYNIISPEAFKLYMNPPQFVGEHIHGWSELDTLARNRTDIYFFGIPSSGKSCLLAGLLHYGDKTGSLKIDIHNKLGMKYANDLIRAVKIGFVPPTTTADGANYISVKLKDGNDEYHPLNFIEMSGEFFTETYDSGSNDNENTIGANGFLKSENPKVIFLIVDYDKGRKKGFDATLSATQSAQLNMVLSLLEEDGTLQKTDAVFLVLTKSDLLPGGSQDYQSAKEFVYGEYASLLRNIEDLGSKYDFNMRIYPFSLGDFMLGKTYNYNSATSSEIFEDIKRVTFKEKDKDIAKKRKRFGLGRLFG